MKLISLIDSMQKELNTDWYKIITALDDRNLVTKKQRRTVENHFFDKEGGKSV